LRHHNIKSEIETCKAHLAILYYKQRHAAH